MTNKTIRDYINLIENAQLGVAEGSLNEFSFNKDNREDGPGEDPYKRPKPTYYRHSKDFFEHFDADHFDREDMNDDTGVFKGYWGEKQIAYFKFDDPQRTGSDDPGMGWYYEPVSDEPAQPPSASPYVDKSAERNAERNRQELGMIRNWIDNSNGAVPKPGSMIHALLKKHGMLD